MSKSSYKNQQANVDNVVQAWRDAQLPSQFFQDILKHSTDLLLLIETDGTIQDAFFRGSYPFASLLEPGNNLADSLTVESREKLNDRLSAWRLGTAPDRHLQLNHQAAANDVDTAISYRFFSASHDGLIILSGQNMADVVALQQELVQAHQDLEKEQTAQHSLKVHAHTLLHASSFAKFIVSSTTDRVADLNVHCEHLFERPRTALMARKISNLLDDSSEWADLKQRAIEQKSATGTVSLRGNTVTIQIDAFRAARDIMLLCRIGTQSSQSATETRRSLLFKSLVESHSDGMVLTDGTGNIIFANERFLDFAQATQMSQVIDTPIATYLARGQVDYRLLTSKAPSPITTHIDVSSVEPVPITAKAMLISADQETLYGFTFSKVAPASKSDATDSAHATSAAAAKALVGQASLKDIVSRSSEVIEETCLKTALEMANNNRAAAAEMLGISRQSFYVKLSKYGIT